MRGKLDILGVNKGTAKFLWVARMPNTLKAYDLYERKWKTFCLLKGVSVLKPVLKNILEFLASLAIKGLGYSSVNSARSALSAFLPKIGGKTIGQHPDVCLLMKGIRNANPPLSRWNATWDVDIVLDFLREWAPLSRLTLKQLSFKLVMLLLITSCQRIQTVEALKLSGRLRGGEDIVFRLNTRLKHNTRGALEIVQFKPFHQDIRLCVVKTMLHYIDRTQDIRKNQDQLLLSFSPPYGRVSSNTMSHWVRELLGMAGLDNSVFTTHSVRSAVSSQLLRLNVPVADILSKASWKSESTFRKYYNKPLMDPDPSHQLLMAYRNTRGFGND